LIGIAVVGASRDGQDEAIDAAEVWLQLIDAAKYDDSWRTAAPYFKQAVKQEDWVQMMTAVRQPLGKTVARELKSTEHRTELPGAPDGEYVIVQFSTSFENKISAVETVTPMRTGDGTWRVSGYFIK
jgi:hypothetical protein